MKAIIQVGWSAYLIPVEDISAFVKMIAKYPQVDLAYVTGKRCHYVKDKQDIPQIEIIDEEPLTQSEKEQMQKEDEVCKEEKKNG